MKRRSGALVLSILSAAAMSLASSSSGWSAQCEDDEQQSSKGCLLEFGDAPAKGLIPGLSSGILDPAALSKVAGTGVATRIWSEPDPREPGLTNHHISIKGSLIDVLGTHGGEPPYYVQGLAIRDTSIALPCGLRVGQPMNKFVAALGPRYEQDPRRRGEARWYWAKFEDRGAFCSGAHATIVLRLNPKNEVREVRWEYYAD